ncbi:inositol monophosphatase family protein [Candidatus Acidulodesulfobacterium sp. H_13]|uniref:inositol monophosphatase family protein n=1 Tax=Candidatus Acidulodesulfobacterium sp. H_13 TaxID=3395470 RepID=UPI003AF6BEAA
MKLLKDVELNKIVDIAKNAGDAIMEIYSRDFKVEYKDDKSPLTEADLKSNDIICKALAELYPNTPMLSEENKEVPYNKRKDWEYYWCIDPIDGTKEFIKKNGEFTVNIALIYKDTPVLGAVYAPALNERKVIISDTVGFIQNLPPSLVKSFKSTLEEAVCSDVLIHVVDPIQEDALYKLEEVVKILDSIGVNEKKTILVLNKIDMLTPEHVKFLQNKLEQLTGNVVIPISAKTGDNIGVLKEKIFNAMPSPRRYGKSRLYSRYEQASDTER